VWGIQSRSNECLLRAADWVMKSISGKGIRGSPSPSGRRWREAPDEGSPPHDTTGSEYDLSERTALTRRRSLCFALSGSRYAAPPSSKGEAPRRNGPRILQLGQKPHRTDPSVRHRVAITSWVCARDPIVCRRIDDDSGRTTRDAVRANLRRVMTAGLQLFEDL